MNQRLIAMEILHGIIYKNKKFEDYNYILLKLNKQELGFVRTIVMGTLRYKYQIDTYIRKISKRAFEKIDEKILLILEISIFQLLYMEHIPKRAVLYEAAELSKEINEYASSKFINAILRSFLRDKASIDEEFDKEDFKYLSFKYSYPKWLLEELKGAYGDDLEKALNFYNREIPFTIRNNTLKITREDLKSSLEEKGFKAEDIEEFPQGLLIKNPGGIFDSYEYRAGDFYVQSLSSQRVGEILRDFLFPKMNILDMCSAPGGKSGHLYEILNANVKIISADINEHKLSLINENMERLGHKYKIIEKDARVFDKNLEESFDLVLADVPCSALGLIRRFPELKVKNQSKKIPSLAIKQRQIIENAVKYAKKGAIIIYSTCSFTVRENQDQIDWILEKNKALNLLSIEKIRPWDFNSDGFSIFLLRKD